jgi:hypothetical protein
MTPSLLKHRITAADIEPWIGAARKYGMIDSTFPPSEVLWKGAR